VSLVPAYFVQQIDIRNLCILGIFGQILSRTCAKNVCRSQCVVCLTNDEAIKFKGSSPNISIASMLDPFL